NRPFAFGLIAALAISILPASPVQPALAISPDIVISEVYGGGGNAGATYTHDYIELYNRGSAPASLAGNSLQYASATGTGNFGGTATQLTELPAATLDPGQYFLVQQASNAAVGSPLPTADFVDPTPIAMAAGAGKVAYVTGTASLGCNGSVGQPCAAEALARIVDLVGYGNANFFEGTAAAPTISATLAAIRAGGGATDTDNNGADFAAGTPDPDSSAEDVAPTVASTVPANGATDVAPDSNVVITFSEPVNATAASFSIACPPGSGALGFTLSGGPTTFTLNPTLDFPDNTLCGVTVIASAVTDQDGTPDPMLSSFSFGFTTGTLTDPCEDPYTPIYSIQGSGLAAAITGTVTTAGVVVGDFEGTASAQGFYLQDA
ncbi:MAG: Ig-like domain-containing protein, partial [Chloroflexota bacterium]